MKSSSIHLILRPIVPQVRDGESLPIRLIGISILTALLLFSSVTTAQVVPDDNGIVYVKEGAGGNGSDWKNALSELATALKEAKTNPLITEIWVAQGTYKPLYRADNMSGSDREDRDNAFVLVPNVKIYGGFDPDLGKSNLSNRDPRTAVTTLSGHIDEDGILSNNAHHVVMSVGEVGSAELNGFTVTGGNADAGGPAISVNATATGRYEGGGIYIRESSPKITQVIVEGNHAYQGAGIYTFNSSSELNYLIIRNNTAGSYYGGGLVTESAPGSVNSVSVTNALFTNNSAAVRGGAVYNGNYGSGQPLLTNVTFTNNSSAAGGAVYTLSGSNAIIINNSIFWDNKKGGSTTAYGSDIEGAGTVKNSITQYLESGNPADHILKGTDPLFTNAAGGDYTLKPGSPAINAGSNQLYQNAVDDGLSSARFADFEWGTDLGGDPRLIGDDIDLGPYESSYGGLPVRWISFEGYINDQQQAILTWRAEESSVAHYEVQRSANGPDFRQAGTVIADGNGPAEYRFTDSTPVNGTDLVPVNGTIYYRIRQVDEDGTFSYSPVVSLMTKQAQTLFAYPNPAKDRVSVNLGPAYIGTTASLVSAAGNVLQQTEVKDGILTLDVTRYAPGLYLLRTHDGKVVKLIRD